MRKLEDFKDPLVIYHGDCRDGFGAAYAAHKMYGDSATYVEGFYGEGIPDEVDGRDVLILDFSFKRKEYFEIVERASDVRLIDHHVSAMKDLEGAPGTFFDMGKSGARLAWDAFVGGDVPELILHIEDIDLWRFSLPGTQHIMYGLEALPDDFKVWAQYIEGPDASKNVARLKEHGMAIEGWVQKRVHEIASQATPVHLKGFDGLAANAPAFLTNEVGSVLAKSSGTFGLVWQESRMGGLKCSLRSVKEFDCSQIAVLMNGGGHKNAAAFNIHKDLIEPLATIQDVANNFDRRTDALRVA